MLKIPIGRCYLRAQLSHKPKTVHSLMVFFGSCFFFLNIVSSCSLCV